jgi:hypothetical protein
MSYNRYNDYNAQSQDDPPLSAREGKSLKERVELLYVIVTKQLETTDSLHKKVKMLERVFDSDSEPDEDLKNAKKIDKNRFSSLLTRASVAAAVLIVTPIAFLSWRRSQS